MGNLIEVTVEADGVLLAQINTPRQKVNVLSSDLLDSLESLMDRVDEDDEIQSVVLTSAKSSFLAGADRAMLERFCMAASESSDDLAQWHGRPSRVFLRLEMSVKPWIAALNGAALGGGLELALACRQRVVTDDPRPLLGLPEVCWGLLPGAGGTQRLPRLAGFDNAMSLLLTGRRITAAEAAQMSIVDAVVPANELQNTARSRAISMHGMPYNPAFKFSCLEQQDVPRAHEKIVAAIAARHGVQPGELSAFPAYRTIIECVTKGAGLALPNALEVELSYFLQLLASPMAGQLLKQLLATTPPVDDLRATRSAGNSGAGAVSSSKKAVSPKSRSKRDLTPR